jgi:hypothetical protein
MKIGEPGWRPTEVHPLAALFPMLDEDDLAALADDIKQHGLRTPIQVDADGRLVDGRNRQDACDRASVEPQYQVLNGEDVEALFWSNNGKRRHMTKGQLAMVAAMALLDSNNVTKSARSAGVSQAHLSQALLIKKFAAHLVADVISGKMKFDPAYTQAQENKRQHDRLHDSLNTLRKQDKTLAQKVTDQEMTTDQAFAELDHRKREKHARRDSVLLGLMSLVGPGSGFENSSALTELPADLRTEEGEQHLRQYFKGGVKELEDKLEATKRGLVAVEQIVAKLTKKGVKNAEP